MSVCVLSLYLDNIKILPIYIDAMTMHMAICETLKYMAKAWVV